MIDFRIEQHHLSISQKCLNTPEGFTISHPIETTQNLIGAAGKRVS
jgi:hypothetical protein